MMVDDDDDDPERAKGAYHQTEGNAAPRSGSAGARGSRRRAVRVEDGARLQLDQTNFRYAQGGGRGAFAAVANGMAVAT